MKRPEGQYGPRPLRVLVTGSRDHVSYPVVWRPLFAILKELHDTPGSVWESNADLMDVIVGDCPTGVDKFARSWSKGVGISCHVEPAEWTRYGNRAGPIRNRRMVDVFKPDLCLAFPWPGSANKGTRSCARYAAGRGIPVNHHWPDGSTDPL